MVPQGPTPGNQALTQSEQLACGAELTAAPLVRDALVELLQHEVSAWAGRGLDVQKERTVRRVFRGRLAGVDVHIKVFRADTIAAKAKDALRRRHKGAREAAHLREALDAGLPAVEPLAYGLARDEGGLAAFVVTRTVDAAPLTLPGRDEDAEAAGRLLRQVHDLGLQPGDLHPGNLLVRPDDAPVLCDLTSMQRTGPMSARQRAAGLAFFCNPIDGGPLDPTLRALLRGYLAQGAMPEGFRVELARGAAATRDLDPIIRPAQPTRLPTHRGRTATARDGALVLVRRRRRRRRRAPGGHRGVLPRRARPAPPRPPRRRMAHRSVRGQAARPGQGAEALARALLALVRQGPDRYPARAPAPRG